MNVSYSDHCLSVSVVIYYVSICIHTYVCIYVCVFMYVYQGL